MIAMRCETHRIASPVARLMPMTKAITVRLDDADATALETQAERLRIRPGTLARMLLHAGLTHGTDAQGPSDAHAALDRLVRRSRQIRSADAVTLVNDARTDLGGDA